jgi:glutaredoxin
MTTRRKVEVFSAGCAVCNEAVAMVQRLACPSCDVQVLDMNDAQVANRAHALGIRSVPAIVIDGQLASCCAGRGVDEQSLGASGLGQP